MNTEDTSLSEKRSSSSDDQPPLKRLKDEKAADLINDTQSNELNDAVVDDSSRTKQMLPTLKKSENHGITEYVSKAHNGFFGD